MEMNTRLQVEHPVTEMITGEDLVSGNFVWLMANLCLNYKTNCRFMDMRLKHVFTPKNQKRLLPAIGKIDYLHYPTQNQYVRVDSGIVEGDEITTYYDPMIAKLIVWGKTVKLRLFKCKML